MDNEYKIIQRDNKLYVIIKLSLCYVMLSTDPTFINFELYLLLLSDLYGMRSIIRTICKILSHTITCLEKVNIHTAIGSLFQDLIEFFLKKLKQCFLCTIFIVLII